MWAMKDVTAYLKKKTVDIIFNCQRIPLNVLKLFAVNLSFNTFQPTSPLWWGLALTTTSVDL